MDKCKDCKHWKKADSKTWPKLKNKGWCEAITYECDYGQVHEAPGDAVIFSREADLLTDQNFGCSKFEKKNITR